MDKLSLLLHPVRMRIIWALAGDRLRTTADLCASLPDVPKTTVYRQVALLVEGGVLEVAGEQRVRGAVERHFRMHRDRAAITPAAGAGMSLDDHRQAFAAAMAALLAEFDAYLNRAGADPAADLIGYRQGILWLSPAELQETIAEIQTVLAARSRNGPTAGRHPRLLSMIQFPTEQHDPAPDSGTGLTGAQG
jgi:Helix-turn-helix domain